MIDTVKVKNCKGTAKHRRYNGLSPIRYWEVTMVRPVLLCSNVSCDQLAEDGAHVFIPSEGRKQYIVPLCHYCNEQEDVEFEVFRSELCPLP